MISFSQDPNKRKIINFFFKMKQIESSDVQLIVLLGTNFFFVC